MVDFFSYEINLIISCDKIKFNILKIIRIPMAFLKIKKCCKFRKRLSDYFFFFRKIKDKLSSSKPYSNIFNDRQTSLEIQLHTLYSIPLHDRNIIFSMASNPINIRWIRISAQSY